LPRVFFRVSHPYDFSIVFHDAEAIKDLIGCDAALLLYAGGIVTGKCMGGRADEVLVVLKR